MILVTSDNRLTIMQWITTGKLTKCNLCVECMEYHNMSWFAYSYGMSQNGLKCPWMICRQQLAPSGRKVKSNTTRWLLHQTHGETWSTRENHRVHGRNLSYINKWPSKERWGKCTTGYKKFSSETNFTDSPNNSWSNGKIQNDVWRTSWNNQYRKILDRPDAQTKRALAAHPVPSRGRSTRIRKIEEREDDRNEVISTKPKWNVSHHLCSHQEKLDNMNIFGY